MRQPQSHNMEAEPPDELFVGIESHLSDQTARLSLHVEDGEQAEHASEIKPPNSAQGLLLKSPTISFREDSLHTSSDEEQNYLYPSTVGPLADPGRQHSAQSYPLHSNSTGQRHCSIDILPNELLHQILTYLDVPDLLATSRVNHHLRTLSLHPPLHTFRLHHYRAILSPLLSYRPSLASLISRSIFVTPNTLVSRRLGRSLVSISLSRKLNRRPTPYQLVERAVLPPECVPGYGIDGKGGTVVAPGLVARRREVERERMKDELRRWIGGSWRGEVDRRGEGVRREDGKRGVGRVWRLRRFWERVSRGEVRGAA